MAMQMQLTRSSPPSISSLAAASCHANQSTLLLLFRSSSSSMAMTMAVKKKKKSSLVVKSSLDTAGPVVGQVTEVNKDTFWPLVNAAADKTVVLDMYTQWCGPCKVMAPKYQQLSEKYLDCVFLKLDCNKDNKELAKELGIRVVPTFKIIKDCKIVKEVTGAKFDDLVVAIESVRTSSNVMSSSSSV